MIRQRKLTINSDDFISTQKNTSSNKGKKIFLIQSLIFLWCCLIIWWSRGTLFAFIGKIGTTVSKKTMSIVSKTIGTKPQLDEKGNLNIALIGYGGAKHDGSYLTDSMIIASINPEKGTMSMLSIPRDLYVKKPNGSYGKINSIFSSSFYQSHNNYDSGAADILGKLNEITWVPLHYYAFIDFHGFEEFIDTLGGVQINVPEPLYDSAYPGANNSYIVFSVSSGLQTMDGGTALKYARSRHSTSDYDRSLRQQAIIQSLMDKITSSSTLLNPGKMKKLYDSATSFIHTNISADEILRGIPYMSSIKKKTSWQIAACGNGRWQTAQAGCLLYTPAMEAFWWMSVQLPAGATPSSISNYEVIKSFVNDTMMNTDFLAENPTVRVLNGINTGAIAKRRTVPVASNTAIDLIEYGYKIYDVGNAITPQTQTTIMTNGEGREVSIARLKKLFPFAIVTSTWSTVDGPSLTLTIGDDYTSGSVSKNTLPLYLQY